MKNKETLEEAAERLYPIILEDGGWDKNKQYRDEWIAGTKWQQERSYSKEDMAESFMACWKANVPYGFACKISFNEWFEQFKKK